LRDLKKEKHQYTTIANWAAITNTNPKIGKNSSLEVGDNI